MKAITHRLGRIICGDEFALAPQTDGCLAAVGRNAKG